MVDIIAVSTNSVIQIAAADNSRTVKRFLFGWTIGSPECCADIGSARRLRIIDWHLAVDFMLVEIARVQLSMACIAR
jgi:hypothetical protein